MRRFGISGQSINNFVEDRNGNFALVFGVTVAMLALGVGYAVNIGQIMNAKSALRSAVDSAVTSTARDLTTGAATQEEAEKTVRAFLTANSAGGILPSDKIVLDKLTINKTAKTVTAGAYVDVDLYFPLFGMGKTKRVYNTGAAVYSDKHIEVAMMLDITGSMGGQKIKDLKSAAKNAVEALLGQQNPNNPRVRAAIVPYAEAVNTGKLVGSVFQEVQGGPIVPPSIYDPVAVSVTTPIDKCATERKFKDGSADFSDDGPNMERLNVAGQPYLAKVNRDYRISVTKNWQGQITGTKCPKAEMIPLTADKQKLLDTIDDFKADGVTAGGIAAQWGYYMLSPKWRSTIVSAGLGDGPAEYDKTKTAKVAILMTDGEFNTAFAGVAIGSKPQGNQSNKSRNYAEAVCDNMKNDDIQVYTIGFALGSNPNSPARAVLKDCATKDTSALKHFFDVSTGPELDAAFKEIISNTQRLALTR